jgi:hypothetical protein
MNIASIIGNTAVGVSKALAQGGFILVFLCRNCSCSETTIAAIAQPLPDRGGFYDGGYTGSGPERNSPGPVHYDEYVAKKVLFSNDPVVPNIVGYLEAKRTGKTHKYNKTKPAILQTNQKFK